MAANAPDHSQLSIVPLGAGDLIDRAVRFYRNNFFTLILIASPPILIGTVLNVGWTFAARSMFYTGGYDPFESTLYVLFTALGSMAIWLTQIIATLVVLGGASRNFVRHLLNNESINFKDTYRNVWQRLGGLVVASTIITILLGIIGLMVFYFGLMIAMLMIALVAYTLEMIPALAFVVSVILLLAVLGATYWLFCLIASRFAYIPQVMMVEGQGVFSSFGRSFSLASGNVKRFAALIAFIIIAAYSALAIIYVPLGWYAWVEGVEFLSFGSSGLTPAWYEIASQLSWQLSIIVISPICMIGLCLLYVDERVRNEGYDIELMAARRFGEIPAVPQTYHNPLQPALGEKASVPDIPVVNSSGSSSGMTTLGLK